MDIIKNAKFPNELMNVFSEDSIKSGLGQPMKFTNMGTDPPNNVFIHMSGTDPPRSNKIKIRSP